MKRIRRSAIVEHAAAELARDPTGIDDGANAGTVDRSSFPGAVEIDHVEHVSAFAHPAPGLRRGIGPEDGLLVVIALA